MNKKIICMMGALLISPSLWALDLVEAYQRAQQYDPQWQAQVLQYESDQLNLGLAQGNLLPTITFSGHLNHKNHGKGITPDSVTAKQVTLTARQPLFRWDAWEGLKQVKTSVSLSEATLRLQKQQHILNVAEAYFNVLRQQSLTLTHIQEEKALLEQLNMMNAKLREGLVARSDVTEANAQYQNAQANRIATQVQVLLAQEQLTQFIGPYQDNLAVLSEDFKFQKPIPQQIQAWQDLAQQHNLELQQARLQYQYAQDEKRVEQAALYPQVEAVGTYGYGEQNPKSMMAGTGQFDQIGLEVNWNVFTGGRVQTNVKQAQVQVNKAQAQLDAALLKANTDVKTAYMLVDTDQTKLQARQAALNSAQAVSNASQAQYREGLKNMVDVLLAQRNAFAAKQDYIHAQYDYFLHVLNLKAAVGQLNEQDLAEMNVWLIKK